VFAILFLKVKIIITKPWRTATAYLPLECLHRSPGFKSRKGMNFYRENFSMLLYHNWLSVYYVISTLGPKIFQLLTNETQNVPQALLLLNACLVNGKGECLGQYIICLVSIVNLEKLFFGHFCRFSDIFVIFGHFCRFSDVFVVFRTFF
jgi:hypothetical protein